MLKEDIEFFTELSNVKIELKTHFNLYGKILRVSDDCLIFETKQRKSIIRFEDIKSIMEW